MSEQKKIDAFARAAIVGTTPPLGDLGRARVGGKVMADIARSPTSEPTAAARRGGRVAALACGAVACVALGWWFGRSSERAAPLASNQGVEPAVVVSPEATREVEAVGAAVETPVNVVRAAKGERLSLSVGRAELTVIGPAEVEITPESRTVVVNEGTVVARANGEALALVDKNKTKRVAGAVVGIRVERSTVVASASSAAAVQRVFKVNLTRADSVGDTDPVAKTDAVTNTNPVTDTDAVTDTEAVTDTAADPTELAAALYSESEAAMKRGDLDHAASLLKQLLADYPRSSDASLARYDLALLAFRKGNHDEAIAGLDAILADPGALSRHRAAASLRCRVLAAKSGSDPKDC